MNARIILWAFLFILSGWLPVMDPFGISPPAEAGEPSVFGPGPGEILILNSYHPGYAWSDEEQAGIVDLLNKENKVQHIYIEYLDCKRFPGGGHLTEVRRLFKQKYGNKKWSLLMVLDNPALEFVLNNRKGLFQTVPVVFCGINDYTDALLRGDSNITGVAEVLDPAETIDLMLRLHPNTHEIVVPHDNTVTGLAVRKEVEALIPRFAGRTRFRFIENMAMKDVLKELEALPKDSLVFEQGFITDKTGHVFGMTETTRLFSKHGPVPVYGTYEQRLGSGMVGGKLLSGRVQGTQAAQMALRILAGEKAVNIPVVTESVLQYMFDYQVMKRFGIPLSALPENSVVINRPPSFFTEHRNILLPGLVLIGFLSLVIGLLLVNIFQRRRSALSLEESEKRFRLLMEQAPEAILVLDAEKGLLVDANLKAERLFGVSREELLKHRPQYFYAPIQPDGRPIAESVKENIDRVLGGEEMLIQRLIHNAEGKDITCELRLNRLPSKDRQLIRASFVDITERQRADERLRESEELYRSLFKNMLNGFAYCRMLFENGKPWDFIYLAVNEAFESQTGLKNVVGRKVTEVIPNIRETDSQLFEIYGRVALTGRPERFEMFVDALKMWFSVSVYSPVREHFVAVFDVISERKKAEEKLSHTLGNLRKALGGIIQVISATVETRDPYTAGHQRRTANLARAIAGEMDLTDDQREGLRMAGTIHDLGKISIPAEILTKPIKLSEIENQLIQAHPQIGYDILKGIDFPWPLAEIVLQHHERMNGSGYPQGLKGEDISLEARILMVADVVEAMASYRPYRPALGIESALEEIEMNKGILYDPRVVEVCLGLFREKGFGFE